MTGGRVAGPTGPVLRLLVTRHIAATQEAALRAASARPLELVVAPASRAELAAPGNWAHWQAEAAFWSTDLMGAANKGSLPEPLAVFVDLIAADPTLRWLNNCATGTDRPVFQQLMQRGVTLTTSSGANALAVAHSAAAGIFALARQVPAWIEQRAARRWGQGPVWPADLQGQQAVIVGCGNIGAALARILRATGLQVTGVRRSPAAHVDFDAVFDFAGLTAAVSQAHWLVLACPLGPQTLGLVDAPLLAALPRGACVVNVARGEVVDEPALFAALASGQIGGVYSDVFVAEPPPPDSPWWTLPNVLMSPHSGGLSSGFVGRTISMFLDNLQRYSRGVDLLRVARPTV